MKINSEIPSYIHYPNISIISYVVRKILKRDNPTNEKVKGVNKIKQSSFIKFLKRLFHFSIMIEKFIFLPLFLIFDLFAKDRDELVVICSNENI